LYLVNDVMVKCEVKKWSVTVGVGICFDPMGSLLEQIIFSCRMRTKPREHTKW